jgi:hypothetical protein
MHTRRVCIQLSRHVTPAHRVLDLTCIKPGRTSQTGPGHDEYGHVYSDTHAETEGQRGTDTPELSLSRKTSPAIRETAHACS